MRRLAAAVLLVLLVAGLWMGRGEPAAAVRRSLDDDVLRLVVLGDSVANGAGDELGRGLSGWLERELRSRSGRAVEPRSLAQNGSRTFHVAARLRDPHARAVVGRAGVIVLSIGGNDLYGDGSARLLTRVWPWAQRQRILARVEEVVRDLERVNPAARIILLGLYNPYGHTALASWLDTEVNLWDGGLIARLAADPQVTVVRIADLLRPDGRLSTIDHFHPGAQGYAAIARRIVEGLCVECGVPRSGMRSSGGSAARPAAPAPPSPRPVP